MLPPIVRYFARSPLPASPWRVVCAINEFISFSRAMSSAGVVTWSKIWTR